MSRQSSFGQGTQKSFENVPVSCPRVIQTTTKGEKIEQKEARKSKDLSQFFSQQRRWTAFFAFFAGFCKKIAVSEPALEPISSLHLRLFVSVQKN